MIKIRKIRLAIVSLLVLGIVWFLWYAFTPTHPISQEQAYALIAREVPLGSSRIEIENWIASKNWGKRYGYQAESLEKESPWHNKLPEGVVGSVACYIEDNTRTLDGSGDLVLVFYLDKEDRMIGYYCNQYSNSM